MISVMKAAGKPEMVYGKLHVQLIHDDDFIRESLLVDATRTARSYVLTVKNTGWVTDDELCGINDSIRSGMPIDKAFRAAGYYLRRHVIAVYLTQMPVWLQSVFAHEKDMARVRIAECLVKKEHKLFSYGFDAEIYSPSYKTPVIHHHDREQVRLPSIVLQSIGISKEGIWQDAAERKAPELYHLYWQTSIIDQVKQRLQNALQGIRQL